MAIFESSLEKIRFINKLNNKDIKTNLIQITNYQNNIGDETFLDIKFELDVIHKGQFSYTKKFLNQNTSSPAFTNINSIRSIVNLFKTQNSKHEKIFNNIERIVSQVYADDKLFSISTARLNNIYTDFNQESKKYTFDLLANFILSYNNTTTISTTKSFAKDLFKDNVNNDNENLFALKTKFIENNLNLNSQNTNNQILFFLKNFLGFNFLNLDNNLKISNGNKPLSFMSINTIKNNIKNNAFDDMSINSLLYGFISNEELSTNKYNYSNLTNFPLIEDDITKEFIPFKYTKNFNLFNGSNILDFTKKYITILSNSSLKNENENEFISNSIESFKNIKNCIYSNNIKEDYNFIYTTKINENLKFESKANQNILAHTSLYKIFNPNTYGITSLLQKDRSDMLQCLNLIANNINSKRIILLKNAISTSPNFNNNLFSNLEEPTTNFKDKLTNALLFHNSINSEETGILNNTLSIFNYKKNNFFANILKNRNICNYIVKNFKKIYFKNTNIFNTFKRIFLYNKNKINELNNFESYFVSNLENNSIISNIPDAMNRFKIKSTIDVAEIREYNNYIIGDQNFESSKNLNEKLVNEYNENINFENIKDSMRREKEDISNIINEYYSDNFEIFKNTSTFFSSIKDICSQNISFLTSNDANADILDTASILWVFNENNTIYAQDEKNDFLNKLTKSLIKFNIIKRTNNNNLKNAFKTEINNIITSKNTNNNIMELFPFFIFTTEHYNNNEQKNYFKTESGFNSINNSDEHETRGLFSHFIYNENTPFNITKLNSINDFRKSKLNFNDSILKKINIAGCNLINNEKVMFIPELYINQNKNYEIKNNIFIILNTLPTVYSFTDYSYSIVLKELITKYSLSKTFNFVNNDVENNLFFNIISKFNILIEDFLLTRLNINTINSISELDSIIDSDNEILSIVENTLKIASDIYCDMSNSLQSYVNISNRVFQSNELNARINAAININNRNDLSIENNIYMQKVNSFISNQRFDDIRDDDSFCFSTARFYYLLTKIFDIDIKTSQLIIKHAGSQNIKIDENTFIYDTLKSIRENNNFSGNLNIINNFPGYNTFLDSNFSSTQFTTFATIYNIFDIFNIYNKKISELISGMSTFSNKREYEFLLTSPTIINYIKNLNAAQDRFPADYAKNIKKKIIPDSSYTYLKIRDKKTLSNESNENFYQNLENDNNYIDDKIDVVITPDINNSIIFENLVNSSFKLNDKYKIYADITDINQIKKSTGLNEYDSHTYPNKYLNIQLLQIANQNHPLLYKKYIDISQNWYNHIYHGLIINDVSLSLSFDFLNFYYNQYLDSIKISYDILVNSRKRLINNLNIESVNNFLKNKIGNEHTKKILNFNKNNQLLQDSYEKAIIKYKSSKNIIDSISNIGLIDSFMINENGFLISNLFKKINDTNDNKGDIIYSYLNDFYIDAKQKKIQNNPSLFNQEINQLYNTISKDYTVNNQAKELLGSHILSVGIDHDIKLNKNDIIVIQVELIDHDFPEIVWEPKIFEYHASFDDISNGFIQNLNIDDTNLPIKIKNRWSINNTLKDNLIKNINYQYDDTLNLTNNIFSKTYNNQSFLNPIEYISRDEITDINILKDKVFDDFMKVLDTVELNKINIEMLNRCKHNQITNFKLKKVLKLISGIDTDLFTKNIDFNKKLILKDVYDIFVTNALLNNTFEDYEIKYTDFIKAIDITEKIIDNYTFYTGSLSSENKINIFIKFLSDFSKAVIEDFCFMTNGDDLFQKTYNIAINPKDFIISGFEGEINITPSNQDLDFEKIQKDRLNIFLDEIDTEPNFVLRMLSKYTINRDDITYFKVKYKDTNNDYIPKNISYRITTKILK